MGLLTFIQIPCHHVLANEIALNFKYSIGLKHFFNINLGIGIIKKTTFFLLYFRHISLCFYSNFDRESSLDAEFYSASNKYPHCILLTDLATPKTRNTWKKRDDDVIITFFSGISCFWGRGVHQKYAVWVLVGCRIIFPIQKSLLIEIWVKTHGDMLKIRTQKVVFFLFSSKINKYYFIIFLRRPIFDLKISLMGPQC